MKKNVLIHLLILTYAVNAFSQTNNVNRFNMLIPSKLSNGTLTLMDNHLVSYIGDKIKAWDINKDYKEVLNEKIGSSDYNKSRSYKVRQSNASVAILAGNRLVSNSRKLYYLRKEKGNFHIDSLMCKGGVEDFTLSNDGRYIYYLRKSPTTSQLGVYIQDLKTKEETVLVDKLNKLRSDTGDYRKAFYYYWEGKKKIAINNDGSVLALFGGSILLIDLINGNIEEVKSPSLSGSSEIKLMEFTPNGNNLVLSVVMGYNRVLNLETKQWSKVGEYSRTRSRFLYFDKTNNFIVGHENILLFKNNKRVYDTVYSPFLNDRHFNLSKDNLCVDSNNTLYLYEKYGISKINLSNKAQFEYEAPKKIKITNTIKSEVIINNIGLK